MFLTSLLAQVLEVQVEAAADLVVDLAGEADAARLGEALQARGHVHPVAIDVVALDDNVAEVDADPERDSLGFGHRVVTRRHRLLDFGGALNGVDDARELSEGAIAHQLDDAAAVLGELGLDQLPAVTLQPLESAELVLAHEAAVADHVSGEDCSKFPHLGARECEGAREA